MKKPNLKWLHTVGFHLCNIPEIKKKMYRNGEQIVAARGYGWDRGEWEQVSEVIKGAV